MAMVNPASSWEEQMDQSKAVCVFVSQYFKQYESL